jgi:isopentenyl-diphosphate delta-isomerase
MVAEDIILVDREGREAGVGEKMHVHRLGLLHRAFSIFVFREVSGVVEILLQKRSENKYHSGGLWSNTCCSHPRPGESVLMAAHRRLQEEMGLDCSLEESFSFVYEVAFANGFVEHEHDHVLRGAYSGVVSIDPSEVASYRWVEWGFLLDDVESRPELYTYWLREIIVILKRDGREKTFSKVKI